MSIISTLFYALITFNVVLGSHDMTGTAKGLGSNKKHIYAQGSTAPITESFKPWDGSSIGQVDNMVTLSTKNGGNYSVLTSEYSVYFGELTARMKVASGSALTSVKFSSAKSGSGIMISGESTSQISIYYNGTVLSKVPVGVDLAQGFHDYTLQWSNNTLRFIVDKQTYYEQSKANFTNPIDVDNWPTTPDTANVMIEPLSSEASDKTYTTFVDQIQVTDYTGGKTYSPNGNYAAKSKRAENGEAAVVKRDYSSGSEKLGLNFLWALFMVIHFI